MNGSYRSGYEIMFAILNSCTKPVRKTHISYYANINSLQLAKYFKVLRDYGFLTVTQGNRVMVTHKGLVLIERLRGVFKLMEETYNGNCLLHEVGELLQEVVEEGGYQLYAGLTITGKSGVLHAFDYALSPISNPGVLILIAASGGASNSMEEVSQLLSFTVQVIDVEGYGIYISAQGVSGEVKGMLQSMLKEGPASRVYLIDGGLKREEVGRRISSIIREVTCAAKGST